MKAFLHAKRPGISCVAVHTGPSKFSVLKYSINIQHALENDFFLSLKTKSSFNFLVNITPKISWSTAELTF